MIRDVSGVQSVVRSFHLLHAIAQEPASSSELARRVALSTSTAARLLATLTAEGAAVRGADGVYRVGPGIVALAAAADPGHNLIEIATGTLLELASELGESASLGIPIGDEMQYVAQMNTSNPVQVRDWVGTRAPLHSGAPGLVVLASLPADRVDAYLSCDLVPTTDFNVTDPAEIRRRLIRVRREGFLWSHQEGAEGISVAAAPVHNSAGTVIASLQAWGPTYRFPAAGNAESTSEAVIDAAGRVSTMLGYRKRTESSESA